MGLGADGADPTSLPDVRFDDRDSNESHVQFLWTVFEGAPESSTQQDDALESFLDGFNSCFDGWFPPPSDGSNAPGGGGSLVGCAVGHPTAVLRGLVTSLRRVHAKLEAALALGASGAQIRTDGPDALQRAAGLASLHACVVATRSAHNRAWLIRLGLLDALTALLKLAMQRLNVLGNLAGMRQPGGRGGSSMGTAAEVATQLGTLELLCAHGASVLSNFLDADLRFGSLAGGCGMDASPGTNAPSSVINRGAVHSLGTESPAVKPLLECGGLTALVEMIRIQRLLRSAPTGSEGAARSLEGLLLRTLGAALAGSAAAQHSLRGAGGLEMLIEGMGDVAIGGGGAIGADGTDARLFEVTASDLAGGDGWRVSAESLELGTTALDVVRRAVKRNGQNVKHAVAAGAFGPRLCAMLRRAAVASAASLGEGEGEWAGDLVAEGDADAFFAVAAKDVRTQPPGTQLRRVFDVLWAFIAGEGKESGGPGGDSGSSGSRQTPGARERLARSVAAAVVEASRLDITAEPAPARTGTTGTTSRDPEPALAVTPEASPTPPDAPLAAPTEPELEHAGFTAATGNPFGGDDDADDPFGAIGSRDGGAFSPAGVAASMSGSSLTPAATSPPRASSSSAAVNPEDVAARAGGLLRRHAAHFIHALVSSYPRAAIDVARGEGAWTQLLSHDSRSPAGVSPGGVAAWLAGATAAGETGGHVTGGDGGTGGNELEVSAMLHAIDARSLQPGAVLVLAPALGRLLAAAPRPASVALLRADGPAKLAGAAKRQADEWGSAVDGNGMEARATRGVLELLATVLERGGPALGAGALKSGPLADLMFDLLWSPGTQGLAIRCLTALVSTGSGTASNAKDAWSALLRRYLQSLPRAREAAAGLAGDPAALVAILAGLRAALVGPGGATLRTYLASNEANGEAYVQVISLLNGEYGDAGVRELVVLDVLSTLRSLLSESEEAAAAFGRTVGYETLNAALRTAWGDVPASRTLLARVLQLAVDADFPEDGGDPGSGTVIRNPGVLPVITSLLRGRGGWTAGVVGGTEVGADQASLRVWILDVFARLLADSVASRAAADQADLLGELLEWFAAAARDDEDAEVSRTIQSTETTDGDASTSGSDESVSARIAGCIGSCASHSLSARNFRSVFRMLADPTVGPKGRRLLLSSLRSAARRDGPAAYFDFTGTGDGGGGHHTLLGGGGGEVENGPGSLVLGHPLAWPSGRAGYTFAAWMRVESFPSSVSSRTKRMALFALRTASGLGVAAELSPDGVDVSTFSAGQSGVAKAENARLPAHIEEKRWMFLVIAHSPGRPPLSTASVKLFVNGEQKSTAKLRFPKVTEPLTASSFGAFNEFDAAAMAAAAATSHHAVAKGAAAAAAVGAAPFAGQFGCVRFFDDVLGHSAVAAVSSLGPDYLGSFSPADTASGLALAGVGMSPSEAREIRESLAPRLVLSLNAAAAYGRDCYSTVADQGGSLGNLIKDVKEKGLVGVLKEGVGGQGPGDRVKAADLVGSARVCATHSARDIIHCLGGVHVLFPLLAPERSGSTDDVDVASAAAELRDAIDLLAAMLEGSRLNQEALQVSGGFALIAHLLRRDGGRRLSPPLLPSMERLVRGVGRHAWQGPGGDTEQGAVRLLLDLRMWAGVNVPEEALAAHSRFLLKLSKRDPAALRSLIPPNTIVDAVAEFKSHSGITPAAARSRRRALLAVMGELLVGAVPAVYYETVQSAFSAVEDAGESDAAGAAAADILEAFVDMLQPGSPLGTWLAGAIVNECCGGAVVLAPLTRTHAQTRAVSIRLLTALMPRSRDVAAAAGADDSDVKSQMAPPGLMSAVGEALVRFPLTHDIRAALFELMLGGQPVPALAAPDGFAKGSKSTSKSSGSFGGVSVASAKAAAKYAAGRFFGSVSSASSSTVQLSKGMTLEPEPGSSTSGVPGIVHASAAGLLLRLLETCEESEMRAGVLELILSLVEGAAGNAHAVLGQAGWQRWLMPVLTGSVNDEERSLALRLFRALHTHAVLRTEGGCGVVETTAAVVAAAGDRNQLDAPACLRTLLADLFEGLVERTLPPPPSEDAGDVVSGSWTGALVAAPCGDNLWSLLPLVTELCSTETKLEGEALRMCEGAWAALEALAPTVASTGGKTPGHSRQNSTVLDGNDDFGSTEDLPRKKLAAQRPGQRATLQRVAFRLIVSYIREAPMQTAQSAVNKLENLLGSVLPSAPVSNEERESTSARLHWFLAALVRAESDLAPTAPDRAALAGRLVGAAVGRGKDVLHGDSGSLRGGVVSSTTSSAVAAAVMTTSGANGADPLRGLISEQKAAAGAAFDAKEGRRAAESRRGASERSASEAAAAYYHERTAERGLLERRASIMSQVCDREGQRRAIANARSEEEAQAMDRRWTSLLRELTDESGPWAAAKSAPNDPTRPPYKWKLDSAEDSSHRRLRLKRDYHYAVYKDDDGKRGRGVGNVNVGVSVNADDMSKLVGGDAIRVTKSDEDDVTMDEIAVANAEAEAEAAAAAKVAEAEREAAELTREDRRKVLLSLPAVLVGAERTVRGQVKVSRAAVSFIADRDQDEHQNGDESTARSEGKEGHKHNKEGNKHKRFWRWPISRVDEVHHARYRLQHVAVEIFLIDRRSAFLAFQDKRSARDAATRIATCRPGITLMDRRRKLAAASRAQERWCRRELSTFDYLMSLNTLAGRTRNDLTQYPVFPWVLSDYHSSTIDLNDPAVFRNLAQPIGALHEPRLKQFIERYQLLAEDPDGVTPPFHYGSHYSSAAIVLFFLIRLQPFAGLARSLQGGRFDHADRLFGSMDRCWRACLESTADVKELIPEFYSLPEFLANSSGFDLGATQQGTSVGDVALPPWANNSPHEFIRVMREALESETVSARMHLWIDLVFGHAQRGDESVRRHNVFHPLTYEGSVDLDAVEDPDARAAAESQIVNFGQTPAQLFRKPHPRRAPPPSPLPPIRHSPHSVALTTVVAPPRYPPETNAASPIAFICVDGDDEFNFGKSTNVPGLPAGARVVTASADRSVGVHRFVRPKIDPTTGRESGGAITQAIGSAADLIKDVKEHITGAHAGGDQYATGYGVECGDSVTVKRRVAPFAADARVGSQHFATIAGGKILLSCGHWDHGLRVLSVEDSRELQIATGHRDLVTCVSTTAGRTGRAWAKGDSKGALAHALRTKLNISNPGYADDGGGGWEDALGWTDGATIVVTGSRDTTVAVWEVTPPPDGWGGAHPSFARGGGLGQQPRRILFGHADAVTCVAASAELDLVASGGADGAVMTHTLRQGRHLRALKDAGSNGVPTWLTFLETPVAAVLVYCADQLTLTTHGINSPCDAAPLASAMTTERLHALAVSPDGRFLVTGGEKGAVVVRHCHDLQVCARYDGPGPAITALRVTPEECVVGGLADGRMAVWAPGVAGA